MRIRVWGVVLAVTVSSLVAGCGGDNLEFCRGCGTPTPQPTSTPTPTLTEVEATPSPTPSLTPELRRSTHDGTATTAIDPDGA
ncbi:MAG: hypothetical protein OZ922_04605 [Myxococcales bacterium]|nr:hypothetical protein [Myxococcales bacterium]